MIKRSILAAGLLLALPLQGFDIVQCAQNILPSLNPFCWKMCGMDFEAETLYLCRDNDYDRIDFTSLGIEGPIRLHSHQLDFGWEKGYRITGRAILEGCDAFEVVWLGNLKWSDSKKVRNDLNNLFSVFSDFGINPPGGFPETDQSSFHKISYESCLESLEANYKNYFNFPLADCIDGVFFYGYRYVSIEEEFEHHTIGIDGELDYQTRAHNHLYGFQLGMEGRFPISCVTVGLFAKGGLYANFTEQKTRIEADSFLEPIKEKKDSLCGSWGLQGGIKFIYDLCGNVHFHGGYEVIVFENVALAIDNFNDVSPFAIPRQFFFDDDRSKFLDNDGTIVYQGLTFGIQISW